jgi:hypothetical protein
MPLYPLSPGGGECDPTFLEMQIRSLRPFPQRPERA